MGEKTPATTTQSSVTQPWANAVPMLNSLLGKYASTSTDVSPAQYAAGQNLLQSASGIPSMGPEAKAALEKVFGADTTPQVGMLSSANTALNTRLGGMANGSELDPYSTPGFSDAIKTMTNDITNNVKGVYAGSGRDPSGAGSFAGSLGRGLTQGIAPVIQSQFNTNNANRVNAANTLYGAGNTTATDITQQQQMPLTNSLAGLQGAGLLSNLFTQPAAAQVSAANAVQQQPFTNLQPLLQAGGVLGGMGSSSSGTGTSAPANDPMSNILGAGMMGAGLLFSDRRLKENIERVGELDDGLPVYRYNFKGDRTPQIGLMAQEVRERDPDAVHDVGGVLAVDYKRATDRAAARAGMLFKEAA